jgi:hypothetical protein
MAETEAATGVTGGGAFARVFEGRGWTAQQYDQLIQRLLDRLGRGRRAAPGVLFHWAAERPDGMYVVDVYESRSAADHLVQDAIGPIVQELGLSMPQITEFDVRNYLRP